MSRRRARSTPAGPSRRSPADRLKRRAWILGLVALVSAAGVTLYNAGHAGQTYLMVRNLADGPVTDVEVTGPQGRVTVDRLAIGEAKGEPILRPADGAYRFHIRYKVAGQLSPESDFRILGAKQPFEAIELVIEPTRVSTTARPEDDGLGGRLGRGLSTLRRRIGL